MKDKLLLLGVAFLVLLAEAEIDIVVPSFPGLMAHYNISVSQTEWVLAFNLVAHGLAGLWVGLLADRYGKQKTLLLGILLFLAGSVLTVYSDNFGVLLLGRVMQGAGMAAPMVAGYLIIMEGVEGRVRERRVATLNGVANVTLAFTPALGSFIAASFSWRANLQVLLLLGGLALLVVLLLIPRDGVGAGGESRAAYGYGEILKNGQQLRLGLTTLFLPASWFAFVGLASIFYVETMGVSLVDYGIHQGSIALIYGLISFLLHRVVNYLGERNSARLSYSLVMFAIGGLCAGYLFKLFTPYYVTIMVMSGSCGSIYLANQTYIRAVTWHPDWGGRVTALVTLGRWGLTAVLLQIAGFLYHLDPSMPMLVVAAGWCIGLIIIRKWNVDSPAQEPARSPAS